ncbi:hypothetical protein BC831DRAFT_548292 [Entophlyctis helioformis]|nr:hypothetical protein BC831DRAFT_548292 [Entophlyctis helioformis]
MVDSGTVPQVRLPFDGIHEICIPAVARIEFGLNTVGQKHEFMAQSLMTRSFKLDGSSQDILIAGDLSASQTVSIATGSGSIKCGKITAASDGGALVQSSSGDMEIGGIFGTSAGIRSSSGYVTLAGPVAVVGAFKIETTSGDVKCKDIIQADTLSIRTSSGFIKMTTVVCDSATLNTTSGDVDASTIETRNTDLTIHTSSGYIRMGDLVVGGSLLFTTTSGDIRLNGITARGHVKLSSSSGSVSAATVWARSLECGSTSGNCKIASVNAVDTVDIKTSSGDLVVQVDFVGDDLTAGERAASLRSTSGDIRGSAVRHYKSATIRSSSSNVGIQLAPLAGSTTTVNSASGDVSAKVAAGYHGTVSVRSHNDSFSARQAGVTLSRGSNFQIVVGESKETTHHSKMDFAGSSSKITVEFA